MTGCRRKPGQRGETPRARSLCRQCLWRIVPGGLKFAWSILRKPATSGSAVSPGARWPGSDPSFGNQPDIQVAGMGCSGKGFGMGTEDHERQHGDLRERFYQSVAETLTLLHPAVGAAEPTLDALVGSPAGAVAGEHGAQVARAEADQRVVRVQGGDHHFADLAIGERVAGARAH